MNRTHGIFCRGCVKECKCKYMFLSKEASDWLGEGRFDILFKDGKMLILPGKSHRLLAKEGEQKFFCFTGDHDMWFRKERIYGEKVTYKGGHALRFGGQNNE